MAIVPSTEYPAQTINSDPGYPHGKARNVTVPGDGTGTPLEADWLNDLWGFLQAALSYGGVSPSGVPDTASASDYLDALKAKFELVGPATSTNNAFALFDGTTGKVVKNSLQTIDGSNNIYTPGEYRYTSSKTREVYIPGAAFRAATASGASLQDGGSTLLLTSNVNQAYLDLYAYVPSTAIISSIVVRADPGAARATVGDRIRAELWSVTGDATTTSVLSNTDDGTAGVQDVTLSPLAFTVDKSARRQVLMVRAGSDAGTNNDKIHYVKLTFSDLGPRND